MVTLLDLCVSSLRRGHANLLCIVPILTDDPRRESNGRQRGNVQVPRITVRDSGVAAVVVRSWVVAAVTGQIMRASSGGGHSNGCGVSSTRSSCWRSGGDCRSSTSTGTSTSTSSTSIAKCNLKFSVEMRRCQLGVKGFAGCCGF